MHYSIWQCVHLKVHSFGIFPSAYYYFYPVTAVYYFLFPEKSCIYFRKVINIIQLVCLMLAMGSPEEFSGADLFIYCALDYRVYVCVCVCMCCLPRFDFGYVQSYLALVMCSAGDCVLISSSDLTLLSYVISFHFDTFYQTLMKWPRQTNCH